MKKEEKKGGKDKRSTVVNCKSRNCNFESFSSIRTYTIEVVYQWNEKFKM